jgi:hypothetical protein
LGGAAVSQRADRVTVTATMLPACIRQHSLEQ